MLELLYRTRIPGEPHKATQSDAAISLNSILLSARHMITIINRLRESGAIDLWSPMIDISIAYLPKYLVHNIWDRYFVKFSCKEQSYIID